MKNRFRHGDSSVDDFDVIKRVQDGDNDSFSILVKKYHKQLLNFIYRITGDEKNVEDIGQEVFLGVYKSLRNFDMSKGVPFSAWLFITARNRSISELRKNHRVSVPMDGSPEPMAQDKSPEQDMIDNERLDAIRSSLQQLSEPYRGTILKSLSGSSLNEIASFEGISAGAVKSRLFRAREMIRFGITQYFGGENDGGF
jgi:RNA polymerase sigma-70 factor (ECF subfamily)